MIITGVDHISQLLNAIPTLHDIDLNNNDIGDEGITIISEALLHNKSLAALGMVKCGLSVKGTAVATYILCK